jgi:deoxyribonuclease-4
VAAKSADAVAHALRRGGEIGARGVVVHTGSAAGWVTEDARERALRQIGEIALPLLDKLGDDGPDLLFEPMAGQGQMLCARAGDLATYLSAVEHHPKAGVCLDTCHMFAAGHDLTADGGVAAMLSELGTAAGSPGTGTGISRVKLVHANDSLLGCGSKRDRHETIGAGMIGKPPFRELPDVAFVVETPGGKAGHARDIATLKELRAAS